MSPPLLQAAEVCGSLEIDSAIDTVKSLSRDLAEAKREAKEGRLLPLPGESVESCALELGATSKTVGSSMAQLLTAANQGEHLLNPSTLWVMSQYPLGHIPSYPSIVWVTFQYPLGHIPIPYKSPYILPVYSTLCKPHCVFSSGVQLSRKCS